MRLALARQRTASSGLACDAQEESDDRADAGLVGAVFDDDGRPGLANDLLAAVFSLERHVAGRVPMPFGVSLLGLARVPAGSKSS